MPISLDEPTLFPRFLKLHGSFSDKNGFHRFGGQIKLAPSGIFSGRGLKDFGLQNPLFDVDGFIANWGERLVMIFLKRYQNPPEIKFTAQALPDVLYYSCHQNHGMELTGNWNGWWMITYDAPLEAYNLLWYSYVWLYYC